MQQNEGIRSHDIGQDLVMIESSARRCDTDRDSNVDASLDISERIRREIDRIVAASKNELQVATARRG